MISASTPKTTGRKRRLIKRAYLYLAIGLVLATISGFGLYTYTVPPLEKQVAQQHDYIQVSDNIEMSEYDLKKLEKYSKRNDGELPFTPVANTDDSEVSLEDVLREENTKLGKAPNRKFW